MRTFRFEVEDTSLVDSAIAYASRGWPVLPLVPREKRPLTKSGLLDATTDRTLVREWWRRWPLANVGLRTGVAFDVLDIDGDEGFESLGRRQHDGPVALTSKGQHWLFSVTGRSNGANIRPKLDFRGRNGYIVAPPSFHPSGVRYSWLTYNVEPPPAPNWLLDLLSSIREPRPEPVRIVNPYAPAELTDRSLRANRPDILLVANSIGLMVTRHGPLYKTNCIYHDGDRDPSLVLYPHDNHFHCFGCGAHGDSHDLANRTRIP